MLDSYVMDVMRRIATNREKRRHATDQTTELDAQLTELVREALSEGHPWQDLSDLLGVSKARIYQIRDGRR